MSNLWRPGAYQGFGRVKDYFEGWYYKSVDKEEKTAYAVMPGVSLSSDRASSYSFVMFLDSRGHKMFFFKYPLSDFVPERKKFEFTIGKSMFSNNSLMLDLDDGEHKIKSDLKFHDVRAWPVTLFSPGIMGWYGFMPKMECKHAILSFDHDIEGFFHIDGSMKDFSGGKGYMEKDWGASMPSSWIWMQTNHFETDGVSLTGSIAKIPWMGKHFTGYIFGMLCDGKLYRFATYTGAKVSRLETGDMNVWINVEDKKYRLEIDAERAAGVDLLAPVMGEMTGRVNESLSSVIHVKLFVKKKNGDVLLFTGAGRNAGLELKGDMVELIKGFKK